LHLEEFGIQIEGIREAVGRVNAQYERAVIKFGKFHASRSCDAGLPDAALASEH
jgi:hypothetical protein